MANTRKPTPGPPRPVHRTARPITIWVGALSVLVAWELIVRLLGVRHSSLPSPSRVLLELWRERAILGRHALITGFEALEGLFLALFGALLLALLAARSTGARRIASPAVSFLRKLPLVALAPLIVIWFGYGYSAAVALSFLTCFMHLAASVRNSVDSLPAETIEIVETMGASPTTVFLKVRLPSCLPSIVAAVKTSIPLALTGASVMEFIGSDAGLGYLMLYAGATLDTNRLFASLAVLLLMDLGLYYLVDAIQKRFLFWPAADPAGTGASFQKAGS